MVSTPGEGSVLTFTLSLDSAFSRTNPVVLVIEDEPSGRELFASYLNPFGIRAEFAGTAEGVSTWLVASAGRHHARFDAARWYRVEGARPTTKNADMGRCLSLYFGPR